MSIRIDSRDLETTLEAMGQLQLAPITKKAMAVQILTEAAHAFRSTGNPEIWRRASNGAAVNGGSTNGSADQRTPDDEGKSSPGIVAS